MRLGEIVLRIRSYKTHFGNFIGGAIELDTAIKNTLKKDMAFVIPLIDEVGKNQYDTSFNQRLTERFGVIVALANDTSQSDKLGFLAYDQMHDIRGELIKALCGWIPIDAESQICYRGGKLVDFNNGYIWYQFEFEYDSRIIQTKDGVMIQESNFDDMKEPVPFNTIYMQLIKTPDARIPYKDKFGNDITLSYPDNFPDVILPDMANWIDLTLNPDAGAFSKGFRSDFKVDYE
jgi:hypothetical protein